MILSNLAQTFALNREKTFVPAFLRSVLITDLFDNLLFWKKVWKKSSILDPKSGEPCPEELSCLVLCFFCDDGTLGLNKIEWQPPLPP